MKLKGEDYANSVAEYNTKFNQAVQLNSVISSYKTKEEAEANRVRDDARANANLMINSVKGTGKSWDSLDADVRVGLQKIALQAGIDEAVFKEVIDNTGVSEIISTQSGYDADGNEIISFIVKDKNGNPKILNQIKPGTVATKTVEGAETGGTIFTSESTGESYDLSDPKDVKRYKEGTGISWVRMASIMDQSLTKLDASTRDKILNQAGMGNFINYTFLEEEIKNELAINDDISKEFKKKINAIQGDSEDEKIANYIYDKLIPEIRTMKEEGLSDTEISTKLFK
jgi:hypothetical protein